MTKQMPDPKDVYSYHPDTGEYTGPTLADPDPMRPERYLIPRFATDQVPPSTGGNEAAVYADGEWTVVEDHRGEDYWLEYGDKKTMKTLGPLPEGATKEEPEKPLEILARDKKGEIDAARDDAFASGLPYTFADGTEDVIQTRAEDKTNLLGIALEAQELIAEGIDDATITFRPLSNKNMAMVPVEALELARAALDHTKTIYATSWSLKDAVTDALDVGDREAVESIEWPQQ